MFLCVAVLYVNYKLYFLLQIPTNHSHICVVVCGGNDIGGQCPVWLAEALVNRQTEKGFKIPANFCELVHQFDKRLAKLASGLVYWWLDPRLRRCLSPDGVQFDHQGQRPFPSW
ncbi:hypothetical protein EB796_004260 [Bugula neritina]|uniref:Uncharacterized protein n=1 Tax=Bugula neritina TaxID=10212 RepID=A0A7J7KIL5_BUGNE|nr:hypothetical protein EB796_004260 [Bugula neritina]